MQTIAMLLRFKLHLGMVPKSTCQSKKNPEESPIGDEE